MSFTLKGITTLKTTKEKKREYGSFWYCSEDGCKEVGQMTLEQYKLHLKEKHGKEVGKDTKVSKRMTMHMDGSYWYSSQYECEVMGLKAVNSTCNKRSGEDAMYWRD